MLYALYYCFYRVLTRFSVFSPLSDEDNEGDLLFIKGQNDLDEAFSNDTLRFFMVDKSGRRSVTPVNQALGFGGPVPSATPTGAGGPMISPSRRNSITRTERINWVMGEMIGSGAVGQVYLGLNIDTGELMAVKQVEHGDKAPNMKGVRLLFYCMVGADGRCLIESAAAYQGDGGAADARSQQYCAVSRSRVRGIMHNRLLRVRLID